ncbi:MAG: hypothetical protein PHR56_03295 [Dehalococcoidales bacterium]|nr:hypothetical protein [Dehalococcoidales bacterium]
MKTIIVIIIAAAAVLVLVIAGVDFFKSRPASQPPITQTPTPSATPSQTAANTPNPTPTSIQQNATNLEQAINNVASTGKSQEVTITISESEANTQAAAMLSTATMPPDVPMEIKSVAIDFKSGNIITANIDAVVKSIISLSMTVKVQAQVSIQSGKPAAKVTDVSFTGSALLPQSVKDQITVLITQEIDQFIVQLTSTQLAGGKVTLEYLNINVQESSAAVTVLVKPN